MTLNCSAYNCTYNNSGTCYAGSIQVAGDNDLTTDSTICSTFTPADANKSFANTTSNSFTTSSDINCKARKCTYNNNHTCTASSVQINLDNASCSTFVCK